jgi:hypothetical protein
MNPTPLAWVVTEALTILKDPAARASAPIWRHTRPLVNAVLDALPRPPADHRAGGPLTAAMQLHDAAPLDHNARFALAKAVTHVLADGAAVAEPVAAAARAFEEGTAIRLVLGERFDPGLPLPTVDTAALAAPRPPRSGPVDETCELAVIVDFRAGPEDDLRLRNTVATLQCLQDQTLDRRRYRIIVVEQSGRPLNHDLVAPLADVYLHAPNDGPYNRSWAHNVGVVHGDAEQARALCFLDADMLIARDLLERAARRLWTGNAPAVLPYTRCVYLDPVSSARAIEQRFGGAADADPRTLHGYQLFPSMGGCILVRPEAFWKIGGFDERYAGWGDEDNDFFWRLGGADQIPSLDGSMLHLHHPRPVMETNGVRANASLLDDPLREQKDIGRLDRFRVGVS